MLALSSPDPCFPDMNSCYKPVIFQYIFQHIYSLCWVNPNSLARHPRPYGAIWVPAILLDSCPLFSRPWPFAPASLGCSCSGSTADPHLCCLLACTARLPLCSLILLAPRFCPYLSSAQRGPNPAFSVLLCQLLPRWGQAVL